MSKGVDRGIYCFVFGFALLLAYTAWQGFFACLSTAECSAAEVVTRLAQVFLMVAAIYVVSRIWPYPETEESELVNGLLGDARGFESITHAEARTLLGKVARQRTRWNGWLAFFQFCATIFMVSLPPAYWWFAWEPVSAWRRLGDPVVFAVLVIGAVLSVDRYAIWDQYIQPEHVP